MAKMLLTMLVREPREWYFMKEFQVDVIPRAGEGISLGGDWHNDIFSVTHDILNEVVEVECICDLSSAACFLAEIEGWQIHLKKHFLKDEEAIRKYMRENYGDEINFVPVFAKEQK